MKGFYKDQHKVELKVGIIVIVTILILVFGYAWLKNTLQLSKQTVVQIRFANAQGLEVGDKVTVNGMQAGKVTAVSQLADGVMVQISLVLKHPLYAGTRFVIQDSNLMGSKQLEVITVPEGKPLDTTQIQQGSPSASLTALLGTAAETLTQINLLAEKLNQPQGIVSKAENAISATELTVKKVGSMVDDNRAQLTGTLTQLNIAIHQMNELLSNNKSNVERTLKQAPEALAKAQDTLDSLQTAAQTLKATVRQLTEGKGTLPLLMRDDSLYKRLNNTTARLDSLLADIKKNPTRYFKVKVF